MRRAILAAVAVVVMFSVPAAAQTTVTGSAVRAGDAWGVAGDVEGDLNGWLSVAGTGQHVDGTTFLGAGPRVRCGNDALSAFAHVMIGGGNMDGKGDEWRWGGGVDIGVGESGALIRGGVDRVGEDWRPSVGLGWRW